MTQPAITIILEKSPNGHQISIFIPLESGHQAFVYIQNTQGSMLRKLPLDKGYNSIDISGLSEDALQLKVETADETILKRIELVL